MHKIAGAAAEKGIELLKIKQLAQKTISNIGSIGFAFTSCIVPAKGTPTFELGEDQIEFGMEINGERGIKSKKIVSADGLANKMVDKISNDFLLSKGDEVAILINGLGATPLMEL